MKMTSLCYIENDEKYLMLHRVKKKNDQNKDKWIGIGGAFEYGETPEECIRREIYEETSLKVVNLNYRGLITFVSNECETEYMHLFHADTPIGVLGECDEGTLEWVNINDIDKLPIWQGDKIFLDLLKTDIPFFSLKLCYEGDILKQALLNEKNIVLHK